MAAVISHIGVLVENLEEAIGRWSANTGWTFKEIVRYQPDGYTCKGWPEEHAHSQRIAFTVDGPPYIELLEVNPDEPTHAGPVGFHHIAFENVDDIEQVEARFAADGAGTDGRAVDADGNLLLFFVDPASPAFDGVPVEYVSSRTQPVVAD